MVTMQAESLFLPLHGGLTPAPSAAPPPHGGRGFQKSADRHTDRRSAPPPATCFAACAPWVARRFLETV